MSDSSTPRFQPHHRWRSGIMVLLTSSVIGVLFAVLLDRTWQGLWQELVVSCTIGCCIWLMVQALYGFTRGRLNIIACVVIAVPIGLLGGGKLATLFGVGDVIGAWVQNPLHEWRSIGASLIFAAAASVMVVLYSFNIQYRLELETERRRSAENSRTQAIAELALLQAQIEPHFLFNTLAHVQSAIDQDPALGKTMLEHLIRYLRGTLRRSRRTRYALGEEQELVEALLSIAALRLGSRLRWRTQIDPALRAGTLPPLLLQPLVENAIRHGIEPSLDGGEILIEASQSDGQLKLTVTDTGVGLSANAPEGVGLSNVRARLVSLYGTQARLTLCAHSPRGVVAELRLPWQLS